MAINGYCDGEERDCESGMWKEKREKSEK